MKLKKSVAVAFALVLTVTAVGCGGSKKDDDVSAADASQSEKQSDGGTGTTTTTAKTTTTTPGSGSDSDGNGSDDPGSIAGALGSGSDCLNASIAYAAIAASLSAGQADTSELQQKADELKDKIPSEIRDDFETVTAAWKAYAQALQGLDPTDYADPENLQKMEEASQALDSSDVQAAQQRIDDYFENTCGS